MLIKAKNKMKNISNVDLLHIPAENISELKETFDVISFGCSFHWMDRTSMAIEAKKKLNSSGYIAIIGASTLWRGKEIWQKEALKIIKKYLGATRKAGKNKFEESKIANQDILKSV